jgi:hypothetical protein
VRLIRTSIKIVLAGLLLLIPACTRIPPEDKPETERKQAEPEPRPQDDMLTRAHTSTASTNISEAGKAIVTYQQLYGKYPNNWDALGDGKKIIDYFANGSALPASQGGPGENPGKGELTALTLTEGEAAALTGVGITWVQGMVLSAKGAPADFDPTFNYYSAAKQADSVIILAAGTVLAGLDPAKHKAANARCIALNLPLTGRYVALGIGPRSSMIGKTLQSPPVHFGDLPVLNPEYGYMRFCAIFKVSDSAVDKKFTEAQFVGVGPVQDDGLGGIQDDLQAWYQLTTGGS